ncbi:EF-P 5-aminopentanol modification-associated protein YfmF [Bacillus sp. 2205SS5-2]|uniref:EF-P 5-aminopentanol modification-associated protein YfmF n=1 Tax=Bacillus sp. 2205SS5-2 TaxID=3109031 RepID=UPI00300672CC
MSLVKESVFKQPGYNLHVVKTDKYKTNTLVWKMKAPLMREDVTVRGLLPYILQSSTANYPTTTKLRSYLDELYGASFFVDLSKKGERHVMSFSVEVANEKFLKDPTPLLKKALAFLAEVVLQPNLKDGAFHTDVVEQEKKNQKQRIQSIYDDKMRFSSARLVQEMCKGEPYALQPAGIKEEVDKMTTQDIYDYYLKAINKDELDLYVIGDVEDEEVKSICSDLFSLSERPSQTGNTSNRKKQEEVHVVTEKQQVNQGKLNIGYRTNVTYGERDYYALQVFNGIFGGFSHSKLFINVREKASLAYYAASRLESHKGLMMVMSGIDMKNYDQAVTIIKEQMQEMINGNFTDGELNQTKAVIRNQLLETIDTSRGIVEVLYHNVVAKADVKLTDWLESIESITKEEVTEVASKIQMDTIYFLTGLEGDE